MLLRKTEKGRNELKPGVRTLPQRDRMLLVMVDGNKPLEQLQAMFDGAGKEIVLNLVRQGYLEVARDVPPPPPSLMSTGSGRTAVSGPAPLASAPAPLSATTSGQTPAPRPVAVDSFEGKRSLATTRMFLFDICERMFTKRNPELAKTFRDALRNAKDRESMLAVSRDMLEEIEKSAGPERADSISERVAALLPPEMTA